jgi:uncharacterized membrane protein
VPYFTIATMGLILFLVVFVIIYLYKSSLDKDSFDWAHCHYMTKTIWIFSLFALITIIAAYLLGDHSVINHFAERIANGHTPPKREMMLVLGAYSRDNLMLFVLLFIPVTIYLVYRLGKGAYKARKGILPNLKSWI